MPIIRQYVVHGRCLPGQKAPHSLRCTCGFVVVSQSVAASIRALEDHRTHGCIIVEAHA